MSAVFLHIGLPKTGTTYLQQVLWDGRERLNASGVLVPGTTQQGQVHAVWDFMGRRLRGADLPQLPGSWQALVDEVRGWSGSHAVISEEFLSLCRPRQAARAVSAFAPLEVHVVVTVRDLARVIVATWQQEVVKGQTWSWPDYIAAVRDPQSGVASAGVGFWLRQDVVRVLDTWETAVPRDRIHIVTLPAASAPREHLLERFATATRLDVSLLEAEQQRDNISVGPAEAEVLRRLNASLGGRLNERQMTRVVQKTVRRALQSRPMSARMQLPPEELGWVTERARAMVDELRARDYHVVGDLDDLRPEDDAAGPACRPDEASADDIADAAMTALTATVEGSAKFWWRMRRHDAESSPAGTSGMASSARAAAYRSRLAALAVADRNRVAGRVAAWYGLRRSTHL